MLGLTEIFPLVIFKLWEIYTLFCLSHTGLFYGGVCIAMAAVASLLGALLQVGVSDGFFMPMLNDHVE